MSCDGGDDDDDSCLTVAYARSAFDGDEYDRLAKYLVD